MKGQRLVTMALVLLMLAMPQVEGSVSSCSSWGAHPPTDVSTRHPVSPSAASDCGPQAHVAMGFTAGCVACGAVLLSNRPFLPDEMLWQRLDAVGSPTLSNMSSPYWRPPA